MASDVTRLSIVLIVLFYISEVAQMNDNNATSKSCKDESGAVCVFPFTYKRVTYNKCIYEIDSNASGWCSTKLDKNGNFLPGHTGLCSEFCLFESEIPEKDWKWETFLIVFLSVIVALQLILMVGCIVGCWIKNSNRPDKNKRLNGNHNNHDDQVPLKSVLKKPNGNNGSEQEKPPLRRSSSVGFDRRVSISVIPPIEDEHEVFSIRSCKYYRYNF